MPTEKINSKDVSNAIKGIPSSLVDSFNKTNLDTQNPLPVGGPINDPLSNFETKYSATNPYLQQGNLTSSLVEVEPGGDVSNLKTLKITALDVASDEAGVKQGGSGGPNRTNATNQFNTVGSDGTYQNYKASTNPLTPLPSKGEVLTTRENKPSTSELNAYTPQNTYLENMVKFKEEAKNNLI